MPRASAPEAYSTIHSGVRCAETTLASCATPKRVSISSACRMVSQSDLLPMMMPTRGCIVNDAVGQTIVFCRLPFSKTDHKERWSVPQDCQQLAGPTHYCPCARV